MHLEPCGKQRVADAVRWGLTTFLFGFGLAPIAFAQNGIAAPGADLAVTKTGPASVAAGNNAIYSIVIVNNGPNDAQNVTLTDAMPAGTTFAFLAQIDGGDGFACTTPAPGGNGTITCTIAVLPAGNSDTFELDLTINSNVPPNTTISNTATVSSSTSDPTPGNNSATSTLTVTSASADLSITKTGSASVQGGTNATYTITVMNNGPNNAQSVTLTDALPVGETFVSFSNFGEDAFLCTTPSVGGTGTISCTLGTFLAFNMDTFVIVVRISPSVAGGTTITNTATISSSTSDPTPGNNNSSTAASAIAASADLSITKAGPATITAGTNATYTITVTNNGPSDAQSVSISDALPPGTTFVSESQISGSDNFACTGTATITCTLANFPGGNTDTFAIVFKVSPTVTGGTTLTNTATVSSSTPDPDMANNSFSAASTVGAASADLAITKSGPAAVAAGLNVTYTITVTNNGPSDAPSVMVTDPTPAGTTFVSNSGACVTAFPCSLGTLTSGQSVIIRATYTVNANAASGSTITNTSTVSSAVNDPNAGNNSSTSSATVSVSADLSITKTGSTTVTNGTNATYQIAVSDLGPANSSGVTVTDAIPSNTSFVSATPSQGSCSGTTTVTCSLGTINAGSSATIAVVLRVTSGNSVTNTASVTAATPDPNLTNNTATSTAVPVIPLPPTLILILTGIAVLALYQLRRKLATH